MPLDPKARAFLDQMAAMAMPPVSSLDPATYRQMSNALLGPAPDVALADVVNRTLPGPSSDLPIRIYRAEPGDDQPVLVFFHGGGFVICGLDSHDSMCRVLARRANCTVISVDYRLAPEHKFPAAVDDAYAAVNWIAANAKALGIDPDRIAIGGDSAGGNLSAVTCLQLRDCAGPRLCHQLLIYPGTNFAGDTESKSRFAEGYLLSREMMDWFHMHYLPKGQALDDPRLSPLYAPDLGGLPPATVITAEFDPLRDEGEAYAKRLVEAGVPVRLARYNGVFHGFSSMVGILDQAEASLGYAASGLREAFSA